MRAIPILILSGVLLGCAADAIDGASADLRFRFIDDGDCHPRGFRWNCRPDSPERDRPRVYDPHTRSFEWPVAPDTPLMDGLGHVRGVVASSTVRINYGVRKRFGGRTLVYAWAVPLRGGPYASGWVPEAAVRHRRTLRRRMRTLDLPNPDHGHYRTRWTVTGGDGARFADLTVTRGHDGGGRRATDYLLRPGGVVNLIYNVPGRELGGYNVDTFPTGVTFRRARGVRQLRVPLYRLGGTTPVSALHFAYGYVHDGEQRRYGWIAKEALASDRPDAGGTCAARCCDGHVAAGLDAGSVRACVRASSAACDGHGRVLRARDDGHVVYRRARSCWARCRGEATYERLDGVTRDCASRAAARCGGVGLDDATWRVCAPG